jgi:glycerol uptake facilitator-like aquaporin
MNPARKLGPDIVSGDFTGWRVYVVCDLVGATIAARAGLAVA